MNPNSMFFRFLVKELKLKPKLKLDLIIYNLFMKILEIKIFIILILF